MKLCERRLYIQWPIWLMLLGINLTRGQSQTMTIMDVRVTMENVGEWTLFNVSTGFHEFFRPDDAWVAIGLNKNRMMVNRWSYI